MRPDPEDYNALREELDLMIRAFRDLLNQQPRILRPLQEARDAAKTKYEDLSDEDWSRDGSHKAKGRSGHLAGDQTE